MKAKSWQLDLATCLALCLVCTGIFCTFYSCWNAANWSRPWFILGDVPAFGGYFKAVAEGDGLPFQVRLIQRLNAPFAANWSDFPTTEELIYLYGGLLTRLGGAIWAYNVCLLTAHLLTASSFFASARLLGAHRLWAALGAVAFANSRYIYVRDVQHVPLSFCWLLPIFWVAARWLWEGRPLGRRGWTALVLLSFLASWQNPYYWYFWMVMLVPALVRPALQKRWPVPALVLSLLSVVFLLAAHVDTWRGWQQYGRSGVAWERTLSELQVYQLRIPEFFLPFEHRWAGLSQFARISYYKPMTGVGYETESSYLGLLGIAGMLWLLARSLRRIGRGQLPEFEFGASLWVLCVALGGGLNMLAGAFGVLLFRCGGRFSVLLLCGFLLYLVCRLSEYKVSRWRAGACMLLLPLLLWDQVPARLTPEHFAASASYVDNERALVNHLETSLSPGAMIFQWPHTGYPETPPVFQLAPYEQMMAWIFSHSLRFSYGDCRGRPESNWQAELRGSPPQRILEQVQAFGFAAVVVYTKGLAPEELSAWQKLPTPPEWRSPSNDRWVYRLKPPASPILPELKPSYFFDRTFYGEEKEGDRKWRWCAGSGGLNLLIPSPCPFRFRCELVSYAEDRAGSVDLDGRSVWQGKILCGTDKEVPISVDLAGLSPGNHHLRFRMEGPYKLTDDRRQLVFQMVNPRLERIPGAR